MFHFMRIKVYRRKYLLYLGVLLMLCVLIGSLLCSSIHRGHLAAGQDDAMRAFEQVEGSLVSHIDEIERYVLTVYANRALLDDLIRFMEPSAQAYLSARLDAATDAAALPSFPDDVRAFATTGGRRLFSQISVHASQQVNVIAFDEGGSAIAFGVPETSPLFQGGIQRGIFYTRMLASPSRVTERIGEIRFLLSSEWVFQSLEALPGLHMAVLDVEGNCKPITDSDAYPQALFHTVAAQGRNQGELREGLDTLHYATYTSGRFGYHLVSIQRGSELIARHLAQYIFVILGLSLVFFYMVLLITLNFRQDSRFLSQIIDTIQQAKRGRFDLPAIADARDNEYGMIARELWEMGSMLEDFIRREYLLKIRQQETEMLALQQQINPHFLYNTLEILRGRASVAGDPALSDAIAALGRLYRNMAKLPSIITVGQEIELLRAYLDIMEFRYGERFCYQMQVDEALRALPTVKFWMQPLAENFFKHGFDGESGAFNLLVLIGREEADAYALEMINNGAAMAQETLAELNEALALGEGGSQGSIGLRNVASRLSTFYGQRFAMRIENNREGGVTIVLRIAKEVCADVLPADR